MEPVRCWEEHGNRIEKLIATIVGDMKAGQLKKGINDSTIGKLNKDLEILPCGAVAGRCALAPT